MDNIFAARISSEVFNSDTTSTWHGGGAAARPSTSSSSSSSSSKPAVVTGVYAVSHALVDAVGGLWSCSATTGLVQVWCPRTCRLIYSWMLDCPGLNELVTSRLFVWGAGNNGSIFQWDKKTFLPVSEIVCHTNTCRSLCLFERDGCEFLVSGAAGKDSTLVFFQIDVPSVEEQSRARLKHFPDDLLSVKAYDRYGFRRDSLPVSLIPDTALRIVNEHGVEAFSSAPDGPDISAESLWRVFLQRNGSPEGLKKAGIDTQYVWLSHTLQELVKFGVPDKYRGFVWGKQVDFLLRDEPRLKIPGYYSKLKDVNSTNPRFKDSKTMKLVKQVELDLLRTFSSNKFFGPKGRALPRLRRVLYAFMRHNPTIGYCQGFNFIVGFALLILDEESTFWFLVAILEKVMPVCYYVSPMVVSRADQLVLQDIISAYLPVIDKTLTEHQIDLGLVTFHWFFILFVTGLSPELTLQVWDNLLISGMEILFHYAYAILKMNEAIIVAMPAAERQRDMIGFMKTMATNVTDGVLLHRMAFDEIPFPPQYISERRRIRQEEVQIQEEQFKKSCTDPDFLNSPIQDAVVSPTSLYATSLLTQIADAIMGGPLQSDEGFGLGQEALDILGQEGSNPDAAVATLPCHAPPFLAPTITYISKASDCASGDISISMAADCISGFDTISVIPPGKFSFRKPVPPVQAVPYVMGRFFLLLFYIIFFSFF